ncbi:MAG: DUF1266 domain-containing protein [Bacteroides sp.]|nr:DUF1266 domain-containing protein [Bacteroides sp.]
MSTSLLGYAYLVLIIILLSWFFLIPHFRRLLHICSRRAFRTHPGTESSVTADRIRALNMGLINTEQIGAYTDSLVTGVPVQRTAVGLQEHWGVTDPESAREVTEWLLYCGNRAVYPSVLHYIRKYPDLPECIRVIMGENMNGAELAEFASNLVECMSESEEDDLFPYTDENLDRGILAWDASRLVSLVRMSCEQGFLTEAEAWYYIEKMYEQVKSVFPDWQSFATSYVIGRGMWGGSTFSYESILSLAHKALFHSRSPWERYPLHIP